MKRLSLVVLSALALVVLLSGCFIIGIFIDPSDGLTVMVGSETYVHQATYDFGLVDATGDPVVESGEIANISSFDLTVTAVTVDSEAFTVEISEELPFTVEPGQIVSASITFLPVSSGEATGTITVQVERTNSVFELNLTGEGNYPPVAQAVTVISGAAGLADSDPPNGTYVRGPDTQNGVAIYWLAGTDFRIYGDPSEGVSWFIDNDFNPSLVYYELLYTDAYSAPNASNEDWSNGGAGSSPPPSSIGEIKSQFGGFYSIQPGDTVSPNYVYFDADGDGEGATTYQWYASSVWDGVYSPIPGATSSEYVVESGDNGDYLKVLVTPRGSSGVLEGEPVLFGPSPNVFEPAG